MALYILTSFLVQFCSTTLREFRMESGLFESLLFVYRGSLPCTGDSISDPWTGLVTEPETDSNILTSPIVGVLSISTGSAQISISLCPIRSSKACVLS